MQTFYVLSIVQALSQIGSHMTGTVVGIWLFQQTGDTSPVLLTIFFASLPQMIGGVFMGTLIDRWDKRYVLILSDVGQAVATILLMFSLLSEIFQLWHLYVLAFCQGLFGMMQAPTILSLITTLVPDDLRERANAIRVTTGRIAGILSPTLLD